MPQVNRLNLLYGPRRQISASRLRQRSAQAKRAANLSDRQELYREQFEQGRGEILQGDSRLLDQLLSQQAPWGVKAIERQQLIITIPYLETVAYLVSDRRKRSISKPSQADQLAIFIKLRDRAQQRRLNKSLIQQSNNILAILVQYLVNEQIISQLNNDQHLIGPLPEVGFGQDFHQHLAQDKILLCGQDNYHVSINYPTSRKSVLEHKVNCKTCLWQYSRRGCRGLGSSDWLNLLQDSDLINWGLANDQLIADPDLGPEEMVDRCRQTTITRVNRLLEPFSSYRLS